MSKVIKLPTEKVSFQTDEGIGAFIKLFPGQGEPSANTPGSMTFGLELSMLTVSKSMIDAATVVAQTYDPADWERHVWGRKLLGGGTDGTGLIHKLEEMTTRKAADYPYAAGRYVRGMNKTVSLKMLKMENANLADPIQRKRYDDAMAAAAPCVYRFFNLNLPDHRIKFEQMNQELLQRGQAMVPESEAYRKTFKMEPHEVWSGCIFRCTGRTYWSEVRKTVQCSLENVLFVREGERLMGTATPDQQFAEFAPSAELAPPTGGFDLSRFM